MRARFMAFHGQVNSETTIYATGLEYEASHYSNRRTVETFSRAADALMINKRISRETDEIDG